MLQPPDGPEGETQHPSLTSPGLAGSSLINHLHKLAVRSLNPVIALHFFSVCFDGLNHARDQLVKLQATVAELPELPLRDDPFSGDHVIELAGVSGTSAHAAAFALAKRTWEALEFTATIPQTVTEHCTAAGINFSRVTSAVIRRAPTEVEWTADAWKEICGRLSILPAPDEEIWENALALERHRAARRLDAGDRGENHGLTKTATVTPHGHNATELGTYWAKNPLGVFRELKGHVLEAIEIVMNVHELAVREPRQTPMDEVAGEYSDQLLRVVEKAQDLWYETPIPEYLEGSDAVHLDTLPLSGPRVTGSCYHELALGLAVGLLKWIHEKLPCDDYAAHMRSHAAVGDGVGQRLATIRCEVSCECQRGIQRWKEVHKKAADPETGGGIDGQAGQENTQPVDLAQVATAPGVRSEGEPTNGERTIASKPSSRAKKVSKFGIELNGSERIAKRGTRKADFGGNGRAWEAFTLLVKSHPGRLDSDSLAKQLTRPCPTSENIYRIVAQIKAIIEPLDLALESKRNLGWLLTTSPNRPQRKSRSNVRKKSKKN